MRSSKKIKKMNRASRNLWDSIKCTNICDSHNVNPRKRRTKERNSIERNNGRKVTKVVDEY